MRPTFRDYLYAGSLSEGVSMKRTAMWVSPSGKMLVFDNKSHIDVVIETPGTFGYTIEKIKALYAKHNEHLGAEGQAREEIIVDLVKRGWVRFRRYDNYWSATVATVSKNIKDVMYDWATKILNGVNGHIEKDRYMPVRIVTLAAAAPGKQYTVDQIAHDKLYETRELHEERSTITIVEEAGQLYETNV